MFPMTLRVFITGGTFDKEYDEIHGRLDFGDTHLPEMLRRGRCQLDLELRTLMMVDSLEMTDTDRDTIARNCLQVPEHRIVITHGTDTMVDTARVLAQSLAAAVASGAGAKTVVLTGAMIPYAFGSSDGLFNLGSALSFAQVLPAGVYVAMNGRCFPWDNVRKNRETGRFEPLLQTDRNVSPGEG
jgi:L-asparaginase